MTRRKTELDDEIQEADHSAEKVENLDRLAYELAFGCSVLSSAPLRHIYDLTSRCNFRCLTCHQSATQNVIYYDLTDVSLSALEPAMIKAHALFAAGMGEPLLSRSAFHVLSVAKASGAHVEAITNGVALSRGTRALPAIDQWLISVDGGTAESHDAIRRRGSFERLVADLRDLNAADRRKVCFNVVVCRQNIYTLGALIDLGADLAVGHIHLQEMQGYLPWHDRMVIGDVERGWLFSELPAWVERGRKAGVSVICNLVPGAPAPLPAGPDLGAVTRGHIDAVADVPFPAMAPRRTLEEIFGDLESFLKVEPPAIFRAIAASLNRLSPETEKPSAPVVDGRPDWAALRDYVEADKATFPHCMSTYAQMVVNGDGTTRSCCTVQSRLAYVERDRFEESGMRRPM